MHVSLHPLAKTYNCGCLQGSTTAFERTIENTMDNATQWSEEVTTSK